MVLWEMKKANSNTLHAKPCYRLQEYCIPN